MMDNRRWMTDDKAGQVQSELSAGGTKLDIENTPKCTRPKTPSWPDDPVQVRRLQDGIGPSDHDDNDSDDDDDNFRFSQIQGDQVALCFMISL